MVRLSQIYTKTGDDGTTALGDGVRVAKTDLRVEAYGSVDEANAAIGLCVIESQRLSSPTAQAVSKLLIAVQNDLFDVGADLCCPITPGEAPGGKLRITSAQTMRLERMIDEYNDGLKALTSFVLPGGTPLAAALHVARTVCRRAERRVVDVFTHHPESVSIECVRYLNRLSDLLFVLSRVANDPNAGGLGGLGDVLWTPGLGRSA